MNYELMMEYLNEQGIRTKEDLEEALESLRKLDVTTMKGEEDDSVRD